MTKRAQKRAVVFLQLPLLDNDPSGRHENLPMAAFYLRHAVERSPESKHWKFFTPDFQTLEKSDGALLAAVERWRPDVLALTLYLWNVERSLDFAVKLKAHRPAVKVVAGGPEVAADHPFLFERDGVDVAVYGEGEPVFPFILRALREEAETDFVNVAWRRRDGFVWGRLPPPVFDLRRDLPPADHPGWQPDPRGIAYLETIRGCPLRCAFCCYGHRRQRVTALPVEEVERRARVLLQRGARYLRFVDPTFNARHDFDELLVRLGRLIRKQRAELFAELRGETITARQAALLSHAGFREIEAGMQTRDPESLKLIRRPVRLRALDRGIRYLARAGIRVTVDLMYGLPRQTWNDIRRMIRWAARQKNIRVQCLQTLLLPGTELRRRSHEWGFVAEAYPPYAVRATDTLTENQMRAAEEEVRRRLNIVWDCPTQRFVGCRLPDLFAEKLVLDMHRASATSAVRTRPKTSRCAVLIRGSRLYERRGDIAERMQQMVTGEPHVLWQFVVCPEYEEPLDLLEAMAESLRALPEHVLDRFIQLHSPGLRAARRILVLLNPRRRYARDWQRAAEEFLRAYFY